MIPALLQWFAALGGVAGIGAMFKVVVDWRAGRAANEKLEADATQIVTDTAVKLLAPLRDQVAYLTSELAQSQQQVRVVELTARELRAYVDDLVDVLRAANIPVPPPAARPPTGG